MNIEKEMLHEAQFWEPSEEQELDCFLCAHRCHILNGKRGVCGIRINKDGRLYTFVYGRVIAENVDPIEKKPLYHFLPGTRSYSIATPGCNFRCDFCQNWQISQVREHLERYPEVDPDQIVSGAVHTKCASIAYTYTEPTIFMEYALDVARLAQKEGIKNVFVTNGYQTAKAIDAMHGLIDAANVDLKSFSETFYRRTCKGKLEPVLDSIRKMHDVGIHIEVTTLVIPSLNDSDEELEQISSFLADISPDIPWHISRFHPDYQALDLIPTPLTTLEKAFQIGEKAGLRFIYIGNIPADEHQNTHCPQCGKTVIQRSIMQVKSTHLKDGKCAYCGTELPLVTS